MSQYPFPPSSYSPPSVDPSAWIPVQRNAAGRTAAIVQMILGGLTLLFGTCMGSMVLAVSDDMMNQMIRQQQNNISQMINVTPHEMRIVFSIFSCLMLIVGGVLFLLAFFVWRGGKIAMIFSIILNSLITLFMAINLPSGFLQATSGVAGIFSLLILLAVLTLCGVAIVKLIAAYKSAGESQMRAMQQAYYWMMQQQQVSGGFGQSGYGYGQGVAAPPTVPQPPGSPGSLPPPPSA